MQTYKLDLSLYKIITVVRALSLVNNCVYMRVCKHGCDITRILIGYVLSDARFHWLVGNMSVYQENLDLFQSRSKIFYKSNRGLFPCLHLNARELGEFSTVMQILDCVSLGFAKLSRILPTSPNV